MKTIKFEVEIDLVDNNEGPVNKITDNQLLEMASEIDMAIRMHEREFGILPKEMQFGDIEVKLIRVKPNLKW
jgi:uncharacterized protein YlaN (UPF0358 family)